ncbi:MAG: hypothetical protein ABR571_04395 [Jatrophihabitans sp.]|uniref:hypothetical protein n=1 Tax=Jatrophihabitans sp. TaxID=1932789 RepID=UPI003916BBEA
MADDEVSLAAGLSADDELAVGGRRLPRRLRNAVAVAVALTLAVWALVIVARPQIATGHGSVAAATAQRYHDEHIAPRPAGKAIRGFFLL